MPDYKGYEYAARWKADHWEIEVYQKKPGVQTIFEGTLKAPEATEQGSALAFEIGEKIIDALTDQGEAFVLGSSTLSGPDKMQ